MLKYKIMFNQPSNQENYLLLIQTIHLLFCNNIIVPPIPFRHNHYVPLNFCSDKNKVNKKRKLVTSQKLNAKEVKGVLLILYIIFGSETYLQIILCPILLMI